MTQETKSPLPVYDPDEAELAGEFAEAAHVEGDIGQHSIWWLMWRRFLRNRLAIGGVIMLTIMYIIIIFAGFFAPYDHLISNEDYVAPCATSSPLF